MTPRPTPPPNRYLDARVLTASQPELQLMMLDGAIRFGQQARQAWDDSSQRIETDRLTRRMLDIVEELVRSVSGRGVEAAARLEEEYAYIFRQVAAASIEHDVNALDAALKLLAYQRDTWRLAGEMAKAPAAPPPNLDFDPGPVTGFSFQA